MRREEITDEHMRNLFIARDRTFGADFSAGTVQFFRDQSAGDWDAWIAEHDRQVAERAWNEGFDEAMDDIGAAESMAEHGESTNPYRRAS